MDSVIGDTDFHVCQEQCFNENNLIVNVERCDFHILSKGYIFHNIIISCISQMEEQRFFAWPPSCQTCYKLIPQDILRKDMPFPKCVFCVTGAQF